MKPTELFPFQPSDFPNPLLRNWIVLAEIISARFVQIFSMIVTNSSHFMGLKQGALSFG